MTPTGKYNFIYCLDHYKPSKTLLVFATEVIVVLAQFLFFKSVILKKCN